MKWLLGLSESLQQFIIYSLIAVIIGLGATSGYLYVSKASVEVKLAQTESNYNTCKTNTITLENSVKTQNEKIEEQKKQADLDKAAAKAKVDAANKTAEAKYNAALEKWKTEKPRDPTNLCLSAQESNADFIKAIK